MDDNLLTVSTQIYAALISNPSYNDTDEYKLIDMAISFAQALIIKVEETETP